MGVLDTSTGDLGTISQRRVIITNAAGTILVPTGTTTPYVKWSIGDVSVDISVLTRDLALTITTQWLNVSNVVVDEVTNVYVFDARNIQFYYQLASTQTGFPPIVQNTNYFRNAGVLYTNIKAAQYAILFAGDKSAAQSCLERATTLSSQQNKYF